MMGDEINNDLKVMCPFCNAAWTAEMESELVSICEGCDTCGDGKGATILLQIRCSNCKRVVYAKETDNYD